MSHSQFHSIEAFILRHAWLSLWDKHMTTGRINQVTTGTTERAIAPRHWACTVQVLADTWHPTLQVLSNPLATTGDETGPFEPSQCHQVQSIVQQIDVCSTDSTDSLTVKRCKPGRHWIQNDAQPKRPVAQPHTAPEQLSQLCKRGRTAAVNPHSTRR